MQSSEAEANKQARKQTESYRREAERQEKRQVEHTHTHTEKQADKQAERQTKYLGETSLAPRGNCCKSDPRVPPRIPPSTWPASLHAFYACLSACFSACLFAALPLCLSAFYASLPLATLATQMTPAKPQTRQAKYLGETLTVPRVAFPNVTPRCHPSFP